MSRDEELIRRSEMLEILDDHIGCIPRHIDDSLRLIPAIPSPAREAEEFRKMVGAEQWQCAMAGNDGGEVACEHILSALEQKGMK